MSFSLLISQKKVINSSLPRKSSAVVISDLQPAVSNVKKLLMNGLWSKWCVRRMDNLTTL